MKNTSFSFDRSLFIDSSNLAEIKKWNATGVIDGVTTNPMIMFKDGVKPQNYEKVIKDICHEMAGKPVSVELTDSTASPEEMIAEGKRLNALAPNIVVKVPLIPDTTKSLYIIKKFAEADIAVNVTTMMTFEQMVMAILAARHCSRPSFVSIFWGRSIEDHEKYRSQKDYETKYPKFGEESEIDADVFRQVAECAAFLADGGYDNPKIIVGSLRTASQVGMAFSAGGNIPTVPPAVLEAMLYSTRTVETVTDFDRAWRDMQKVK
jgi:transaldolase